MKEAVAAKSEMAKMPLPGGQRVGLRAHGGHGASAERITGYKSYEDALPCPEARRVVERKKNQRANLPTGPRMRQGR